MDFIIIALFSLVYLIDFMISYSCCVLSERFKTLHFSLLFSLYIIILIQPVIAQLYRRLQTIRRKNSKNLPK